jgi:hypothetical protein
MSPNYNKLLLGPKVSAAAKSLLLLPLPSPEKKNQGFLKSWVDRWAENLLL